MTFILQDSKNFYERFQNPLGAKYGTSDPNPILNKIVLTLFCLLIFRFGNAIPLFGVDQDALKKAFLQLDTKNSLFQILNMYTGTGGNTLLSAFSLGIVPFINASIILDLFTALIPQLEKIQSEEGESGRQKLFFYKKIGSLLFALIQSYFLLSYLKPYFYQATFFSFAFLITELLAGTMVIIWLSNLIDTKGIGNGTSLIIFTNIVISFLNKNNSFFSSRSFAEFGGNFFSFSFFLQLLFLFVVIIFICISQTSRFTIELVSARQLIFLETTEKKRKNNQNLDNFTETFGSSKGLSIRLNQAGIFPIIIASNLLPFVGTFSTFLKIESNQIVMNVFYYLLIIGFNYFYTLVFWDPEKISEQLRKASVSILEITPGKETVDYLQDVVKSTSLLGGIFLCTILGIYEIMKQLFTNEFVNVPFNILNQLNISSLIILIGVSYELQKTIRASLKNSSLRMM